MWIAVQWEGSGFAVEAREFGMMNSTKCSRRELAASSANTSWVGGTPVQCPWELERNGGALSQDSGFHDEKFSMLDISFVKLRPG